jgi:hypothetical protein
MSFDELAAVAPESTPITKKTEGPVFTMKVGTLRDPVFIDAVRRIYSSDKLPSMKTTFHVKNLVKLLEAKTTVANQMYRDLVTTYCEKDEDGKPKKSADANQTLFIPEGVRDEFNAKVTELHECTIDVPMRRISIDQLAPLSLAPAHLDAIDAIVDWSNYR